uniref:Uncharacterized protein n=1 Tax=Anguilla anguilla TaxID=7936 RepID=A0A0E9RL58_ANGAN
MLFYQWRKLDTLVHYHNNFEQCCHWAFCCLD